MGKTQGFYLKDDALVKWTEQTDMDGGLSRRDEEVWCTVSELDRLFDVCHEKWRNNWNLEKVVTAILESDIE